MKKIISIDEINKAMLEDNENAVIIDLCNFIDIESCFDLIFDPPESFLATCKKYWEDFYNEMMCAKPSVPREASEMFQCIKYEDKREVFGFKIHSFSTLDRIKKYDDSDNGKSAEKTYSIEVGEIERTINLYAIASTKFRFAV